MADGALAGGDALVIIPDPGIFAGVACLAGSGGVVADLARQLALCADSIHNK